MESSKCGTLRLNRLLSDPLEGALIIETKITSVDNVLRVGSFC